MKSFIQTRLYALFAIVLTLLAWYALYSRQAYDAEWAFRWNAVDISKVQLIYAVLLVCMVLSLPFAPHLNTFLKRARLGVLLFAVLTCFLSVSLLEPNQEHRLFITPLSIWVIIIHIVSLSAILFWMAMRPTTNIASSDRMIYGVLMTAIALIIVLYFVARAEFMPLDMPDEPFNASIATNYAQNNDLSSQYIGSAYGSPDVVFPRYYWVMGVWLKLAGSTSLAALRAFPVLVGLIALAVLMLAMWKLRNQFGLKLINLLIAATALLSMSTFLRTSHNLRMDVLLALYSSMMLWGMLGFWQSADQRSKTRKSSYLLLMGLALFFGMEAIPLAAVPLSVATGMMLIVWWLKRPQKRYSVRYVLIYALANCAGILTYYLFQFIPNIGESWTRYTAFVLGYSTSTGVGTVRLPLDVFINYIVRFNLILSPVELLATVVALIALWRMKVTSERWMLASVGLGFVLLLVLFRLSYSYMVVFAPFIAYAMARVTYPWKPNISPLMTLLLVGLVAVPVFDLTWSIQARPNQTRLDTIGGFSPLFPPGTTILGEDLFWFTLQEQHPYIGINGFYNYVAIKKTDYLAALKQLKVDALLCDAATTSCKSLVDTGYFNPPTENKIGESNYLIYWSKSARSAPP